MSCDLTVFLIIFRLFVRENNSKEWVIVSTGFGGRQIVDKLNYVLSTADDVTELHVGNNGNHDGANKLLLSLLWNAYMLIDFSSSVVCAGGLMHSSWHFR